MAVKVNEKSSQNFSLFFAKPKDPQFEIVRDA
jgi:hypothetical protein